MIQAKNIDDYLAMQTGRAKEILIQVREIIRKAAPKAEEVISYGMPAYKQGGMVVYFAAFKKHYSLFPGKSGVEAFKVKLKGYKTSAGTIQFEFNNPIPKKLIADIVKYRVKENLAKTAVKKKAKSKKAKKN